MNTVDATELICEGKADLDKPNEGDEEMEDLWSQIMSKDDLEELTSISSLSEANKKRKTGEERGSRTEKESVKCGNQKTVEEHETCRPASKKRRNEEEESILDANLVAFNTLITTIRNLSDQMTRNTEKQEKTEEALLELSCALSKATDVIYRMKIF